MRLGWILAALIGLLLVAQTVGNGASSASLAGVVGVLGGLFLIYKLVLGDGTGMFTGVIVLIIVVIAISIGGDAVSANNNIAGPVLIAITGLALAARFGLVWPLVLVAVAAAAFLLVSPDGSETRGSGRGGTVAGYVALGDSYASGEGAGSYDTTSSGAIHRCHRSENAWPRLIGVPRSRHFACSGATIDRYYSPWKAGSGKDGRSQRARLRKAVERTGVRLVTLTFSGNNLGFKTYIVSCRTTGCPEVPQSKLDAVRGRLGELYTDLRNTVGEDAWIYVVGYPRVVPDAGESPVNCAWLRPYGKNLGRARSFQERLDGMLSSSVHAADDDRLIWVPTSGVLDGHELCTRNSWMYPITPRQGAWVTNSQQGHPRRCGQIAMARAVRAKIEDTSGLGLEDPGGAC